MSLYSKFVHSLWLGTTNQELWLMTKTKLENYLTRLQCLYTEISLVDSQPQIIRKLLYSLSVATVRRVVL